MVRHRIVTEFALLKVLRNLCPSLHTHDVSHIGYMIIQVVGEHDYIVTGHQAGCLFEPGQWNRYEKLKRRRCIG